MVADIQLYIDEFENNVNLLIQTYKEYPDDFFFTEKELHSYFYYLCLVSNKFITDSGFNLIHTEYPTPFKCSVDNEKHIKYADINENNKVRSHVDLVLLNPNFINWIVNKDLGVKYLSGLTNELFSKYIVDFAKVYHEFQKETNEPILLYAIEFKYIRHNVSGTKNPKKEIMYDIAKLELIKNKDFAINEKKIHFCLKTLSLVFIGDRMGNKFDDFTNEVKGNECRIIKKH